jgi:hypothetical protein
MVKPFVKDDVLPKLANLKDVKVKCSSRSDVAVVHPAGFVISRTERDRGQEELCCGGRIATTAPSCQR